VALQDGRDRCLERKCRVIRPFAMIHHIINNSFVSPDLRRKLSRKLGVGTAPLSTLIGAQAILDKKLFECLSVGRIQRF
jgi:hypothetical protein